MGAGEGQPDLQLVPFAVARTRHEARELEEKGDVPRCKSMRLALQKAVMVVLNCLSWFFAVCMVQWGGRAAFGRF